MLPGTEAIASPKRWKQIATWIVRLCLVAVLLVALYSQLFGRTWVGELLVSFTFQYFVLGVIALMVHALVSRSKWGNVFTSLGAAALLFPVWSFLFGGVEVRQVSVLEEEQKLSVLSYNVLIENFNFEEVIKYVQEQDPDVLFLYETSREWQQVVKQLGFAKTECTIRVDTMGLCAAVSSPSAEIELLADDVGAIESAFVTTEVAGESITVVGTHPTVPWGSEAMRNRNTQLKFITDKLQQATVDRVAIVGDFNLTKFSPVFEDLQRAGFADVGQGRIRSKSWSKLPTDFGGLVLDHALVGEGVSVAKFEYGPYLGSDHRPIELVLVPAYRQVSTGG